VKICQPSETEGERERKGEEQAVIDGTTRDNTGKDILQIFALGT
jgi:hypothetical protein